jgi:hypothetical protein
MKIKNRDFGAKQIKTKCLKLVYKIFVNKKTRKTKFMGLVGGV